MAMQWWGTVNLPAVVAGRCNDPCHHRPARADSRWIGWMGRTGGAALRVLQIARRAWNAKMLILGNGNGGHENED